MPDPAVYYNLLGQLYFQIGDTKESAINHSKALKRNPFLWDSFQELNKMGANVRVKAIYKLAKESSGFALGNDTTEGFDSRDPFGEASTNVQPIKSFPKTIDETPKSRRLHFEIVNYEESEAYFQKLRKVDSTRIEDMEYYSTLLWHLHKDVELCHLAHEVLNIDRNAPQSWVVVGNLFSINREPDEAIKCFRRATQLDEKHSYAYTLQGHEYVSNDAYEHALECFRFALLMDPRHYNALYGIGMVYLKLGNFNKAEFHFRKALDINPINVILICCLGMMLEKLGQRENALHQYELACKIQPLSALALFKKAQLLLSMEQYGAALSDFEHLATIAPDEASVHYLLGQLYKLANKKQDAIKQFTIALNLDPKGSQLVKEALEGLSA
ncbi:Protein bimA [Cyberlindnera fabianii]|uniref:Protein bimA n=1 Tax=Cyberlindnera fabianii TaxID=36022 RepID=A0A1V2LCK5_CYBFA|nr:Protein bimA [Cyberlindnera fabianii]